MPLAIAGFGFRVCSGVRRASFSWLNAMIRRGLEGLCCLAHEQTGYVGNWARWISDHPPEFEQTVLAHWLGFAWTTPFGVPK